MTDDNTPILVYTTLETAEDAKKLGRALVEARLAACVNILAPMTAICEWKDSLDENCETPMLIKSRRGLQDALLAEAKRLHPYETPALLVIGTSASDADFRRWIVEQTTPAA